MSVIDATKEIEKKILIDEILKSFEEEKCSIKFPISKNEYYLNPIRGAELKRLKTSNLKTVVIKLIELAISKIDGIGKKINKKEFLESNSHLDYFALLKGLLECSYKEQKIKNFECPYCGYKSAAPLEIEYSQYKNKNKEWDKDVPFNQYEINYEFEIPNKKFKSVKAKLILKIPAMEKLIRFVTSELKDFDVRNIENVNTVAPLVSIPDEQIMLYLEKIILEIIKDENNPEPIIIEYGAAPDLQNFISKLPIFIKERIIDKIEKELNDYVPVYQTFVKCENCGEDVELTLNPQIEFIQRIFNL
jgi:transcription initiation factor IIE alpha subunit